MKIHVAVPTHSETLTVPTVTTLIQLAAHLTRTGHEMRSSFYSSAMIGESRNAMVAEFMHEGYDLLFMLDSDQGIPISLIQSMIDFNQPMVGAFYPRRKLDWSKILDNGTSSSIRDTVYKAQSFVGDLVVEPGTEVSFRVENGFAEARHVGTGCLLIRRDCIEQMFKAYPELKGRGFNPPDYPQLNPEYNYGLFNPGWSDYSNRLQAEDYFFCERWRTIGGKIYANVVESTVHIGRYSYDGSFIDHLKATYTASVTDVPPPANAPAAEKPSKARKKR